jgi:hypothetical protein
MKETRPLEQTRDFSKSDSCVAICIWGSRSSNDGVHVSCKKEISFEGSGRHSGNAAQRRVGFVHRRLSFHRQVYTLTTVHTLFVDNV